VVKILICAIRAGQMARVEWRIADREVHSRIIRAQNPGRVIVYEA
jgi:hypothetical protein